MILVFVFHVVNLSIEYPHSKNLLPIYPCVLDQVNISILILPKCPFCLLDIYLSMRSFLRHSAEKSISSSVCLCLTIPSTVLTFFISQSPLFRAWVLHNTSLNSLVSPLFFSFSRIRPFRVSTAQLRAAFSPSVSALFIHFFLVKSFIDCYTDNDNASKKWMKQ